MDSDNFLNSHPVKQFDNMDYEYTNTKETTPASNQDKLNMNLENNFEGMSTLPQTYDCQMNFNLDYSEDESLELKK